MLQDGAPAVKYYVLQADKMRQEEKVTMFIDFSHLMQFRFDDANVSFNFVTSLVKEYNRFEVYLRKAVTQFMGDLNYQDQKDRYYQIGYYNMPSIHKIRDMKVQSLGRLMSIHGTVTRTTEVKPELLHGSFKCQECGVISTNVEQQFKFTEPIRCANE